MKDLRYEEKESRPQLHVFGRLQAHFQHANHGRDSLLWQAVVFDQLGEHDRLKWVVVPCLAIAAQLSDQPAHASLCHDVRALQAGSQLVRGRFRARLCDQRSQAEYILEHQVFKLCC